MNEPTAGRPRPEAADLTRRIRRLAALPPNLFQPGPAGPDRSDDALIAACVAAAGAAERKRALFDGSDTPDDDAARDALLDPLDAELRDYLEAAARVVPGTWTGHVIRAGAYLLWDAGVLHREAQLGSAGDLLLAAIVSDLATG